jgi:tetratricopeptide (TPR) repeat protein
LLCAYHILAPEDSILKARSIARKAAEIDPFLAEAYEAMGHVEFLYDWDWKKAVEYYEKAITLNPHYATALQRHALLLTLFNKVPQALEQIMQAVNNDPLSLVINSDVAVIYFIQKNYQLAIEKCSTVLDIDPNFILAVFVTGLAHEQLKDFEGAIRYFRQACNAYEENTIVKGALIHALGIAGHKAEAEKLFGELMNLPGSLYISPYTIATAYLGLGQPDDALEWLAKAVDTRSVWLIHLHMKFDPRLDSIRNDDRFQILLGKMQLPD